MTVSHVALEYFKSLNRDLNMDDKIYVSKYYFNTANVVFSENFVVLKNGCFSLKITHIGGRVETYVDNLSVLHSFYFPFANTVTKACRLWR